MEETYTKEEAKSLKVGIAIALVVAAIFVTSKSTGKVKMAGVALGAFCSEIIMVVGYLLYEIAIMGAGAALAGITGNIIQGGVSIVIALVLVSVLDKTRFLSIYSRRMGREQ